LPTNKNTPIIFVTSLADFKSRARSSLSGGADLIAKPFMFIELSVNGQLWSNVGYSGTNFLLGFVLAVAVGVPAGILLGWYRKALAMFDPLINALYATPRIALYPLIIIWFGIGSGSKIFVVFLSAMLPILTNTIAGVRNLDADLLRASRAFCATDRQIFKTVALPFSVPFIVTGVRQGVAHGLIGIIIAEMSAGNEGIGFMISYAGQTFATDTRPSDCSSAATMPTGVSIRWTPGPMRPRCASVATTPIVPWPHMPR